MSKAKTVDMTNGHLTRNIILYSLPLIATNILQILYNAADVLVVAKWAGGTAMAAVGATTSLVHLTVNLFLGISTGANVVVATCLGSKEEQGIKKSVHTAMFLSIICGVITAVLGILTAKPLLRLMSTPDDIINQSTLYMQIYFVGVPAFMIYNFGAAILRAAGDTKRPFYILTASGIINILLNLLFVIKFNLSVAGVAIATSISQIFSAVCIMILLMRADKQPYKVELKNFKLNKKYALKILTSGIPIGIQSALFSFANINIQSSINYFGSAAVSGNTAARTIDDMLSATTDATNFACISFTAQNVGAKNYKNVKKVFFNCLIISMVVTGVLGTLITVFSKEILSLYAATSSAAGTVSLDEIIHYGTIRFFFIALFNPICAAMTTMTGSSRGLGYSVSPTVVTLISVCVFRITWLMTVFKHLSTTIEAVYITFPLSWLICVLLFAPFLIRHMKKAKIKLSGNKDKVHTNIINEDAVGKNIISEDRVNTAFVNEDLTYENIIGEAIINEDTANKDTALKENS